MPDEEYKFKSYECKQCYGVLSEDEEALCGDCIDHERHDSDYDQDVDNKSNYLK